MGDRVPELGRRPSLVASLRSKSRSLLARRSTEHESFESTGDQSPTIKLIIFKSHVWFTGNFTDPSHPILTWICQYWLKRCIEVTISKEMNWEKSKAAALSENHSIYTRKVNYQPDKLFVRPLNPQFQFPDLILCSSASFHSLTNIRFIITEGTCT